jgi:hypothetical protein
LLNVKPPGLLGGGVAVRLRTDRVFFFFGLAIDSPVSALSNYQFGASKATVMPTRWKGEPFNPESEVSKERIGTGAVRPSGW